MIDFMKRCDLSPLLLSFALAVLGSSDVLAQAENPTPRDQHSFVQPVNAQSDNTPSDNRHDEVSKSNDAGAPTDSKSIDPPDAAGQDFFEAKIRPVLVTHCYRCHSVDAKKEEGGLFLDSRNRIRSGGDRGPAVVPGKPAESLLLSAISHQDSELKMPPKKDPLPKSVIEDFRTWIEMGAPDPRDEIKGAVARPPTDIETGRRFWSYQKPVRPAVPQSATNWPQSAVDEFVFAKLQAQGLSPSLDADPAVLLRRLHFDLIGLPPSIDAIDQFQTRIHSSNIELALAEEVDRLLATPQFGERWGRHWMDVARFAESSGKEANISFPYAFRYRDYVVDAVTADIPYDRFIIEQIAGDLLPYHSETERARLLIATGFLAIGPKNLDEANAKQFEADLIDEQIDAVTRAVMASSVACARCHDHKFDPFSMHDYYALAGIFASTKTYFGTHVSPANRLAGDPLVLPRGAGHKIFHASISPAQVAKQKAELAKLKQQEKDGMAAALQAVAKGEDPEKFYTLRDALRIFWSTGGIEGQLEKVDEKGQAIPLAMGVLDRELIVESPLLASGDINRPGKLEPRRFPLVVSLRDAPNVPSDNSGRLEFAKWLVHPDHPLTARVMVNRVWRHLFGAGIVRTMDNFGLSGEPPSHPELLDHLAVSFVENGWSLKKLVREIVLSRTYRQSSQFRLDAFQVDPENRYLWRSPKRRLDAEAIRDAMLAVSGELSPERPDGSLVAKKIGDRPISLIGLDASLPSDLDGTVHRSVYLPVLRDRLPDVLDLFDFAEPSLVTGDRETTNVPVQALYLMNGPFVHNRAKALAARLDQASPSDQRRIELAFQLCFARAPDAEELQLGEDFLTHGRSSVDDDPMKNLEVLVNYCHALLATAEFRNVD